jgi:hypothetical protein
VAQEQLVELGQVGCTPQPAGTRNESSAWRSELSVNGRAVWMGMWEAMTTGVEDGVRSSSRVSQAICPSPSRPVYRPLPRSVIESSTISFHPPRRRA